MKRILKCRKLSCIFVGLIVLVMGAETGRTITHANGQDAQCPQSDEKTRRIWVEEFLPLRRKASAKTVGRRSDKYVRKSIAPIPVPFAQKPGGYKPFRQPLKGNKPLVIIARVEQPLRPIGKRRPNHQGSSTGRSIGITFWRLRPSLPNDTSRRITQKKSGTAQQEWVPERIEAETPLVEGDKVRVSIESPDAGYLYVINSEYYADGSVGEPFLIFPTAQLHAGDNRIEAGQLIDIPAQSDSTPWFEVTAGGQVAELLTIIVSKNRMAINPGHEELTLNWQDVLRWNDSWGASVERIEQAGGAGRAWTNAEQEAGSDASRRITLANPLPQTIYHISTRPGDPLMLTVPLAYRSFAAR